MKNRKSFLKGALCGALAMLLAAGLVSCGLKAKNSNSGEKYTTEAISSETDKKLEKLESLEQLRVLENGHRIAIAVAEANLPPGVDTQADLDRLNQMDVSCFE